MNLAFLPTDTQSCSAVYPRMCSKVPFLSAFKLGIVQVYKDTMYDGTSVRNNASNLDSVQMQMQSQEMLRFLICWGFRCDCDDIWGGQKKRGLVLWPPLSTGLKPIFS